MKPLTILTFVATSSFICFSQEKMDVSFTTDTLNFLRDNKKDKIELIQFKANFLTEEIINRNYKVSIVPDIRNSTFPASEYKLDYNFKTLNQVTELNNVYLTIKSDSLLDRSRQLILKIEILDSLNNVPKDLNIGNYQKLVIMINKIEQKEVLKGYEYLAYIGTNFDLVEGVKAKNLFFAGNIYSPPKNNTKVGFYLSLYGNRTMSQIDSNGVEKSIYDMKVITDSTFMIYSQKASVVSKRTTDNIGAYISPLFRIRFLRSHDQSKDIRLYYSPSLEFVWRRTQQEINYGEVTRDSALMIGQPYPYQKVEHGNVITNNYNEYSFNAGVLGLFLVLENKSISVRVHGSVGYTSNYYRSIVPNSYQSVMKPQSDIFFSGRAWITEAITGLTLQAEVTNTLLYPRPFFVATLSKAISFSDLGRVLQPITSR